MRESDIEYVNGSHWVGRTRNPDRDTVSRTGATHSKPESPTGKTPDGLSIAIARADYLARSRA